MRSTLLAILLFLNISVVFSEEQGTMPVLEDQELPSCQFRTRQYHSEHGRKELKEALSIHLQRFSRSPDQYLNDHTYTLSCLIYHWMDPKKMDSSKATERYDRLEEIVKKEGVKKGLLERLFKQTKGYKKRYRQTYKRYLRYVEPIQALLTGDAAVYEESLKEIPESKLAAYKSLLSKDSPIRTRQKKLGSEGGEEVTDSAEPPPVKEERPVPPAKQPTLSVNRGSDTKTANNRDGEDHQKICDLLEDLLPKIEEEMDRTRSKEIMDSIKGDYGCFNRQDVEKPRSISAEMINDLSGKYLIRFGVYLNEFIATIRVKKLKDSGFLGARKYEVTCGGKSCSVILIDGYKTKEQAQSIIDGTDWRTYGFRNKTPEDIGVVESSRYR